MRFTLMNEDIEVFEFTYDEDMAAVSAIHDIFDLSKAPLAIWNERISRFATADTLTTLTDRWWKRRSIPSSRHNRAHLHHLVGSDLDQLTAKTYALTLTDRYWARPLGSSLTWSEVNYFDHDFEDGIGLLLAGISDTPPHGLSALMTPSATVGGDLPKMWHVAPDGTRKLWKASSDTLSQEPMGEVVASRLYARLLLQEDFVPYRLERRGDTTYSVCPCFIDEHTQFVSAHDLFLADPRSHASPTYATLTAAATRAGAPFLSAQLQRLLALDFILGNVDRHLNNVGIICGHDGTPLRPAPIFDTGMSIFCHTRHIDVDVIDLLANPFLPRQSQQLAFVQDLSWFDEGLLQGFDEEALEVLGQCPSRYMDRERLTFIEAFIASGIRTVAELKASVPLDPDDIAAIEERARAIDATRTRLMKEAGTGTCLHV